MFYIFLLQKKTHPADAIYPLSLKTSTKQCYFREFGHNIIIQQVHVLGFPISDFNCQVIFHWPWKWYSQINQTATFIA